MSRKKNRIPDEVNGHDPLWSVGVDGTLHVPEPPGPRIRVAPWPARLWRWLANRFRSERPMTAEECQLDQELSLTRADLETARQRLRLLEADLEAARSREKIQEMEMGLLAAVLERDRVRWQAEQAKHAADIAIATGPTKPIQAPMG